MSRLVVIVLVALVATAIVVWNSRRPPRATSLRLNEGERRVRDARDARETVIRDRFRQAGLAYPPREIFLRAFKHEAELELWAREDNGTFRHVATWPVVSSSGRPGPKRREGDLQVPEGVYFIDRFNPESSYHLSLGLNYPNASDRLRADQEKPGCDIFIHGSDRTVGCLPLGDPAIEEVYLVALDTYHRGQREIPVHIFPAQMTAPTWTAFVAEHGATQPALIAFWNELRAVYEAFERTRRVPAVGVAPDGAYRVQD